MLIHASLRQPAGIALIIVGLFAADVSAQSADPSQSQGATPAAPVQVVETVTVVGTTPLPGVEIPARRVPAPVQTVTSDDIERSGALDMSDFLNRRLTGVHLNETQNNPFQADLNYRGYTASPLLGTPQGLSVYMDGVRLNQPFGEVVSWDLIPRMAIASGTLVPGSNPLFGLNTLGGALSLQTKDGRFNRGTTIQATYGSDIRRALEFEHGGHTAENRFHWYAAGSLFGEDGWRDDSPTDVRQLFGKIGWQRPGRDVSVAVGHANNVLFGNGLQEWRMLDRGYASVYTKPDETDNRSTFVTLTARQRLDARMEVTSNLYYRDIRTSTLNGDINEDSLDQRATLARCLDNVRQNDGPAETCNGLINMTRGVQRNGGGSAQLARRDQTASGDNLFTVGGAFDRSGVTFAQATEIGYLTPDRSVAGVGAFADGGETGGEIDGEPYDTRVDLDGTVTTWSLFAADTLPIGSRVHATVSGRYNRTVIDNRDQIAPGGGPGSLDGRHTFDRFNPAAGVTIDLRRDTNAYAGYSEGSRAATSIELGCADPEEPCKLPNAMAGDPPLDQVVTRTLEAGVRGRFRGAEWNAGLFRAQNDDDILFVTSEQTGFGYFRNFGRTRRQGIELGGRRQVGRVTIGAGYTLLGATFQSEETVNGESNSTNDEAEDGSPGFEGAIDIAPGDRIPLIPRHTFKAFADLQVSTKLGLDVDAIAVGGSYARGNENNRHAPDGVYYLGAGRIDGYSVVNLGGRYAVTRRIQLIAQINNLFNTEYSTAAQLGVTGFDPDGRFVSRPLPPIDGEYPLQHSTFVAPGAPARAWAGVRVRF